ncbi:LysR substrate-binding domain-containing protein [Marichromatium gracile]|uniref:LysR family transcriptional regulator n=1 Tax=Marichromatium gracile TaxID=1048 RepID=A0ABR5VFS1_MARGR|nr:LysR substrate-binding domain-containing protein [Marichromatium gracile]KXX64240.1 LysR family transcriptional regulator [Marichromatium gracile]
MGVPSLNVELLRTFVTVVEAQGFTQAGARLHRTQPAVSIQVKRLEQLIERPLFVRRKGRLCGLTEAGEVLLGYARHMLRINDDALQAVGASGLAGKVRLGTPEDFASKYLPLVLSRFAAMHPRVQLEVCCDLSVKLLESVRGGQLDLALIRRNLEAKDGRGLYREPLHWVGSRMCQLIETDPLPLALFPEGCAYRAHAIDALAASGRAWRLAYVSPSLVGIQAAVLGGLGVSVLPDSSLLPGHRTLGPAEGLPPLPSVELALEIAPSGLSRAGESLVDYILGRVEDGVESLEPVSDEQLYATAAAESG